MHTIQVIVSHCSKIDVQQETVETIGDPVQYSYDFDGAQALLNHMFATRNMVGLWAVELNENHFVFVHDYLPSSIVGTGQRLLYTFEVVPGEEDGDIRRLAGMAYSMCIGHREVVHSPRMAAEMENVIAAGRAAVLGHSVVGEL